MQQEKKAQAAPSLDRWLREAKAERAAADCGMFLAHNGVVRQSARSTVREGRKDVPRVKRMFFDYDEEKVAAAREAALALPGIAYVRVWLNRGELAVGDDIMLVLVGGDIRPRVIEALQSLVGELKTNCVIEREIY